MSIKELGFSERDIEVLKRYTGLTAEQLYNPDGIHQTGNAFPNGTDPHPANADDSVVEFVGTAPEWVNDGYQKVEVIVYD